MSDLTPEQLEEAELIAEMWEQGVLAWKLRPYQLGIYEIIWNLIENLRGRPVSPDDLRIGTLVACRKTGKSYIETLITMEFGIRYPGSIIRITAPTADEARNIFLPEFDKVLLDCPKGLRPVQRGIDRHWYFPNGSMIVLKGADMKPDRLRGPSSDLNFVDEASFVNRLQYVVDSILYPMTVNTRGPTILCSTLSPSPNSEFNEYYDRCEVKGQAATVDVYSAGFSPEQIEAERRAVNKDTWEIEYECKRQRSADQTVVPEWTEEAAAALTAAAPTGEEYVRRPEMAYWTRFTAADFGTVDNTVILTGYWDFAEACLWITNEEVLRGAQVTGANVAGTIREMEEFDEAERPMQAACQRRRHGDNNIELLQTIQIDHQLPILGMHKLTLETMVNKFRLAVQHGQLRIHPRCVNLLGCLKRAAWKEEAGSRRDAPRVRVLARSNLTDTAGQPLGHFDALMSAVYMWLVVDRQRHVNPLPHSHVTAVQQQTFGAYRPERYGQPVKPAGNSVARTVPAGHNSGRPGWLPPSLSKRR